MFATMKTKVAGLADWMAVAITFDCVAAFDIRFSAVMQMNIDKLWKQTVCFGEFSTITFVLLCRRETNESDKERQTDRQTAPSRTEAKRSLG